MNPYAEFWEPYQGVVSLTFDDGRPTQLEHAIPMMDAHGLRGTFYLCPGGDDWRERLEPWVAVAQRGHEIGNHTISHPSPRNLSPETGRAYDDLDLGEIEREIVSARERLGEIAPHQTAWTFCYPCYHTHVGFGPTRQSYIPVVEKHCVAGRGKGEYGQGNCPDAVDLGFVYGLPCERMSAWEMIGLVEDLAVGKGRWVVLVFHDISGDRLSTSRFDFEQLCAYLERRRDVVRCAPVIDVAVEIRASRE